MDWTWYLFGFNGRINRAKLWLAPPVILCGMMFLMFVLALPIGYFFGFPAKFSFNIDNLFVVFDPPALLRMSPPDIAVIVVNFLFMPLFLWVFVATAVKRLHDRDRSGWWLAPFFVGPCLYDRLADLIPDSHVATVGGAIGLVLMTWGVVELYFLRGSPKTNRFGPNPLTPAIARRRWDQHSEIEMVPHTSGPPPVWHVKRGP